MNDRFFEFIGWILQHYGRLGLLAFSLVFLAVFALIIYLLSRLPGTKGAVESKCDTCKYERKESAAISDCPSYKKARWIQLRTPKCPIENEK